MIIKKKGSRIFIVNLFADFIINKIGQNESSEIQVIDCGQFLVVKGRTSSKNLLNLSDLTLEFKNKFSEIIPDKKLIHTIDLVEYDFNFNSDIEIKVKYYFSDNCSYSSKQIEKSKKTEHSVSENLMEIGENELTYISEFPHGYSLNRGRLLYYYGKKIINSIPTRYPFRSLVLELSNIKNFHDEIQFKVFDNKSECYDEYLESAIRDMFNFDMSEIKNEIEKVDLTSELINPLEDFDFLKTPVENFIIV